MRAIKAITTICWLITGLALGGLAVWFLTGTVFGFNIGTKSFDWLKGFNIGTLERFTGPYNAVGSYSIGTEGVNSLSIDWVSGDITIKPHDGNDIQITEYAQRELNDDEKLVYGMSGDALMIRFREQSVSFNIHRKRLEVLVPRQLCDSLGALSVNSASAGVNISDISPDTLTVGTTSGDIQLTNITSSALSAGSTSGSVALSSVNSGNVKLNTTSGSVALDAVTSDDIKLGSTSGGIRVSGSAAETLACSTTSGRVGVSGAINSARLKSTSGGITFDNSASGANLVTNTISGTQKLSGSFESAVIAATSGGISITSDIVPAALKISTVSGSITVTVPNGRDITVRHSSTSGGFSSDIPVIMQKSAAQFDISTTSGGVRIHAMG